MRLYSLLDISLKDTRVYDTSIFSEKKHIVIFLLNNMFVICFKILFDGNEISKACSENSKKRMTTKSSIINLKFCLWSVY